jgi:hypothetical protein
MASPHPRTASAYPEMASAYSRRASPYQRKAYAFHATGEFLEPIRELPRKVNEAEEKCVEA